uniref:Uncharacterized protein n=1 Tax=Aegilops tauschii subsp. strangulata TaxID=200361 RepID=A0A453N7N3_AEGTS
MKDLCVFLQVISDRVIAEGLRPDESNFDVGPVFVMSSSSSTEAPQKMIQGKVRHLPVVWSLPCWTLPFLCDAISRMEKVAEQGSAIATAVEGVDG